MTARTGVLATIAMLAFGVPLTVLNSQASREQQPATASSSPKLLVLVVVDQMRFDYLQRYQKFWDAGVKRLLSEGAVFEHASYPFANTATCPGHATIATGTYPSRHGVILNGWYRRSTGRDDTCTEDHGAKTIAYGGAGDPTAHTARNLRLPTLGDRLRETSRPSRVVALATKPRSAVMLAGHGGTAVTWFGDNYVWSTSSMFAAKPVPEVSAFVEANSLEPMRSVVWERMRPLEEYVGGADNLHARPDRTWSRTFPHALAGVSGTRASRFYNIWERSPYSDMYLARFAAHLVRAFQLGGRDAVDYLAIGFSAVDSVGHDFGPFSHELQDALIRLDRSLGELMTVLDETVGRHRYTLALTSDHGVSDIPEVLREQGVDAGRAMSDDILKVAESAMVAAYGRGTYVASANYMQVYLTPAARTRATTDRAFVQPLIDALEKLPGIARVYRATDLVQLESTDPIARAIKLSHHPDESGDLLLALKRHWIGDTSSANHGTAHDYDQHVPLIFFGAGITPGRFAAAVSPADIAPTLAALIKLPLPDVDGRPLSEIIAKQ